MKHCFKIFAFFLTLSYITAQESKPSVAVLDFEARGIPGYEAETLTERLRTEIATTKAVRLVDRKLLQSILEEQGLQLKRGGDVVLEKITVAVLDFDPRGISALEAQSLTDRFGNLVSAGIYFYQFQTKDFVKTRKMVLLK